MRAQIIGVKITDTLENAVGIAEIKARLERQIDVLEKKVRDERQPRRKWELNEELKRVRGELIAIQS